MRQLRLKLTGFRDGEVNFFVYEDGDHEVLESATPTRPNIVGGVAIPDDDNLFYVKTDQGAFVTRRQEIAGQPPQLTITPFATWASETGSWIDGTRRMNGVVNYTNAPFVMNRIAYQLPHPDGAMWSVPVDFGDYFFAGVERPVKIHKPAPLAFTSHTYINLAESHLHTGTFPIVNREINGGVYGQHRFLPLMTPGLAYINSDLETISFLTLPQSITHLTYLGNRHFAASVGREALVCRIAEDNTIQIVGTRDWGVEMLVSTFDFHSPSWFLRTVDAVFVIGFNHENIDIPSYFIMKLDTLGNRLWYRIYDSPVQLPGIWLPFPTLGRLGNGNLVFVSVRSDRVCLVYEVDPTTGNLIETHVTGIMSTAQNQSRLLFSSGNDIYIITEHGSLGRYNMQTGQSTTNLITPQQTGEGLHVAAAGMAIDLNGVVAMTAIWPPAPGLVV